ncbi:MAG: YopX family protein [Eubacteriales bacterium]|nr:YopX family protein [Eubacteriales bacterium]
MREILFRGKDHETGTWYEGFYLELSETTYCSKGDYDRHPDNTKHYIVFDRMTDWGLPNQHLRADVDPSTVGQYTGLKDKNGKKIFEGDIVDILTENEEIGVIEYDDGGFQVEADGFIVDFHANINGTDLEVIGNIHDNKSLLNNQEAGEWSSWCKFNIHDNPELQKGGEG